MIEEQFVSFETAKLLKEAGFDVPCTSQYTENEFAWENLRKTDFNKNGYVFSRPTQALAARWLREVHRIFIQLTPTLDGWLLDLFDLKKHQYIWCNQDTDSDSYETAFEAGLQEAVKLINNNGESKENME